MHIVDTLEVCNEPRGRRPDRHPVAAVGGVKHHAVGNINRRSNLRGGVRKRTVVQDRNRPPEALQLFPERVADGKEHSRAVSVNCAKACIVDAATRVIRVHRDGVSGAVLDDNGFAHLRRGKPYARANCCAIYIGVNISQLQRIACRGSGSGRCVDAVAADGDGLETVYACAQHP